MKNKQANTYLDADEFATRHKELKAVELDRELARLALDGELEKKAPFI